MKRGLIILLLAALTLSGCANPVVSTPDEATFDETTADQATKDEATLPPTQPPTEPPTLDELARAEYDKILSTELKEDIFVIDDVSAERQYPDLQAACEAMALTAAINHFGYDIDRYAIVDDYLEYSGDCVTGYCGDPHYFYEGAGIFPPGMVTTVWNFVDDTDAELYPFDTTGLSMDELYRFVQAGCPVLIWTTYDRGMPYFDGGTEYNDTWYPWFDTEHCVCLYGYDVEDDEVKIADSWYGTEEWESSGRFEDVYDEIGRFSMVLMDTSKLR